MPDPDPYQDREHTRVKHEILRRYLLRFAIIVGSRWGTISYVDCFAGPWGSKSPGLEDTSFSIAVDQLRQARTTLEAARGRRIRLRCLFLEIDPAAYRRLDSFAADVHDVEVETRNAALEDSVDEILEFVRRGGTDSFPFLFIDPTGWTAFDLERIAPLIRLDPGEVLINFMTGFIERFVDSDRPEIRKTFRGIYGDTGFQRSLAGKTGLAREDAIVREFTSRLRQIGRFEYVPYAMVMRPDTDRTQFHLVYGTRQPKGLEVFKEAERKAMEEMERGRAGAMRRRRERATRTGELFDAQTMHDSRPYERRLQWYSQGALSDLEAVLRERGRIPYDELWGVFLQRPLVWEKDLKEWLRTWNRSGMIELVGLKKSERVVKQGRGHLVVSRFPKSGGE